MACRESTIIGSGMGSIGGFSRLGWLGGRRLLGGLVATAKPINNAAKPVFELYYLSYYLGELALPPTSTPLFPSVLQLPREHLTNDATIRNRLLHLLLSLLGPQLLLPPCRSWRIR